VKRIAAAGLVLALLAGGCAAPAPTVQRYAISPETPPAAATPARPRAALAVESPRIAPFLQTDGIVYQTDRHTFSVAAHHRWVEPLVHQLRRSLVGTLGRRLEDVAVYANPARAPGGAYGLSVDVEGFHGRFDGRARVAGTWYLHDPTGRLLLRGSFREAVPLERDGYAALVEALSRGWRRVGRQAADRLTDRFRTGEEDTGPTRPVR